MNNGIPQGYRLAKQIERGNRGYEFYRSLKIPQNPDELLGSLSWFQNKLIWLAETLHIGRAEYWKQNGISLRIHYGRYTLTLKKWPLLQHLFEGWKKWEDVWIEPDIDPLECLGTIIASTVEENMKNCQLLEVAQSRTELHKVNVPGTWVGKCPFCLDKDCKLTLSVITQTYRTSHCHTKTGWDEDDNRIRVPDNKWRPGTDLIERINDPIKYVMRNL